MRQGVPSAAPSWADELGAVLGGARPAWADPSALNDWDRAPPGNGHDDVWASVSTPPSKLAGLLGRVAAPAARAEAPAPVAPTIADNRALLALLAHAEAGGEGPDGMAGVVQVALNRRRTGRPDQTDGTIRGTVLKPGQFSAFSDDYVDGRYVRVASSQDAVDAVARKKLEAAMKSPGWNEAVAVVDQMLAGRYRWSDPSYAGVADATLYANPSMLQAPTNWMRADKQVAAIGKHRFYRE